MTASKSPKLGIAYMNEGNYETALAKLQKALKLEQDYPSAHANAGVCAARNKDFTSAEKYLCEALKINPKLPTALLEMASLSYELGRYLPARGYLQRYLEVAKHPPQSLWLGIRIERALGDWDAVASYSLALKSRFPDSDETRQLMVSEE